MSKRIPTGGPAFSYEGTSLRNWFAGQVIGAVIRQCAGDTAMSDLGLPPAEYFAMKAYEVADAMVAISNATDADNEQARKEAGDDLPW